ncbi:MAG: ABC transporter permease subunit [Streptosporangiales bacterium]|nr:ABC transporter permease subunit [Streptosporangiales bacterium]
MRTSRLEQVATYTILGVFTVFALFPIVGILLSAVAPPEDALGGFSLPSSVRLANFVDAWHQGHFGQYLLNSLIVAACVVGATTVLATMTGYAFGSMRFRFAQPLFYLFLVGLMVPQEAIVVPLFYDLRDVGLTDTYWALILPQIAQSLSFGTFWMRAYFRSTPRGVVEAARLDGASSWTTLWRVLLPMGMPALTTMVLLVFMWTWNEFLLALVMVPSAEDLRTAPLGLSFFQGQHTSDFALLSAASVIVAAPVVIAYVALQRKFIAGMLSGALRE